jgi:hypothetical protein
MIFRIPAGKHRARPLRLGLWWNKTSITCDVQFTETCRYDLGNTDQYDINKLIGIGYLPGHHKDSARFGWRYWADRNQIELWAYCYVNGQREIKQICFCEIGKIYRIQLRLLRGAYFFICLAENFNETVDVPFTHSKKLGYRLGTYFGGNQKAPHEIKIQLSKL